MSAYDIATMFTEVIAIKKEMCCLLQPADAGRKWLAENERKKTYLSGQGKLVVTIYEGEENMEKGLQEIVRNHL